MAKTCHLITGLGIGGSEIQLYHLVTRINHERFSPFVVSMLEPGPVGKMFSDAGISVYSLGMRKGFKALFTHLRGAYRFYKIIHKEKADIIILFMYPAILLGRFIGKLTGVYCIISSFRFSPRKNFMGQIENFALRSTSWVDKLTCVNSEKVAAEWLANKVISLKKLRVVPNGVVLSKFISPSLRNRTGHLYSRRSNNSFIWVAIGRLTLQKDFFNLLDAFGRVAKSFSHCSLYIAGDGPLKQELKAKIQGMGLKDRIYLVGVCKDIPTLLYQADALVLSSVWESLPNVILEAMAAGLPIVATDIGGVRELVSDGEDGFLVPCHEPMSLAEAMMHLMTITKQKRTEMGERGRAIAKKKYNINIIVKKWEALYKEVLSM